MNYLQMFAKGGKTKGSKIIKGIQTILGVDDNQMAELWQVGLNKYGSEEGIAEALNEATKGLTQQSSPDEVKAAVASVFTAESEMFKCGGKLQRLAKRFAKGGTVDCGCGAKMKAQDGTKLVSEDGTVTITNPFTELADTTGRYVYPSTNGSFKFTPEGRTANVWDNTGGIATRYADENWIKNNPIKQKLPSILGGHRKLATQDYWDNLVQRVDNRFRNVQSPTETLIITENPEGEGNVAHIPMQQDGGEVTEAANGVRLTRRQARDLSKQNKGYNNNQYITAYYNALDSLRRNSNLRGRDLRNQARIMASGISVGDNSQIITGPEAVVTPKIAGPQKYTEADTSVGPLKVIAVSSLNETPSIVLPQETEGYTRRPGMEGYIIRPYGSYYTKKANESPVKSYDGSYPNGYERREGMENEIIRPYEVSSSSGYTRRPDATPVIPYGPYYTRRPGTDSVRPLTRQKGGVAKGQWGMSVINPQIVRNQYNKVEDALTPANKWEREHNTKVIGGIGLAGLVAPFTMSPALIRIPAQTTKESEVAAKIIAASKKKKEIDAASKAGKIYIDKPTDFDIDKVYFNTFDDSKLLNYIKNTKFTK